jgi:hypothetical protein
MRETIDGAQAAALGGLHVTTAIFVGGITGRFCHYSLSVGGPHFNV